MIPTPLPDRCLHEAGHALYAWGVAAAVHRIEIRSDAPSCVETTLPFPFWELRRKMHQDPRTTTTDTRHILGMILAGGLAAPQSKNQGDLRTLHLWHDAWERLERPPCPWTHLVDGARADVQAWLTAYAPAVAALGRHLERHPTMSGFTFASYAERHGLKFGYWRQRQWERLPLPPLPAADWRTSGTVGGLPGLYL